MQNIIAIENGVTRHPAVPDEGTGEYDTCRRRTYSCCGKKRGRKKYIGRYDYRSVAVVDERSEV